MTTSNPEQLRRDIERTQVGLSADVDALTEKVTPSRIVNRRVNRVRRTFGSMRDTVMGSASDAGDRMGSAVSTAANTVSSAASSAGELAGELAGDAPRKVREQAQGNPLAAGLVAFGLGWLAASLLPASKPEQDLAGQAKDLAQERLQPAATEMAGELKDNLREPAEQAIESIRSTARDAGSTVAEEARSATEDVTTRARDAADAVQNQTSSTRSS
jgi:ElaB/YqjD/DUF883 family membrane-anchored ribosome-binding protein